MRTIPLAAIPNQKLTLQIGELRMGLTIKETRGVMSATLERDGVVVLSGQRVVAGEPIIPYEYLEDGNFLVLTLDDQMPDWRLFGSSQELVYLTQLEIEATRG